MAVFLCLIILKVVTFTQHTYAKDHQKQIVVEQIGFVTLCSKEEHMPWWNMGCLHETVLEITH